MLQHIILTMRGAAATLSDWHANHVRCRLCHACNHSGNSQLASVGSAVCALFMIMARKV